MLDFITMDGGRAFVNPATVAYLLDDGFGSTLIHFPGGTWLGVATPMDEVAALLLPTAAPQDGCPI